MRRLFFVLLLGAAAPACKDTGTTFTFDSGAIIDAPRTDGGGGDGASSDGHATPDLAAPGDAAAARDGDDAGADAGTIFDDGGAD
jgi:hypothetical protein